MKRETKAIFNMLEKEEEIKYDLIDRFFLRDLLKEEEYKETIDDLAFVLEDELRSCVKFYLMDATMWGDIVMPYVEQADYKEIAEKWLSKVRENKRKEKETGND